MPGFFEAFAKLPPQKKKVHTVTIQGQSIVVTLQKKIRSNASWRTCLQMEICNRVYVKTKAKTYDGISSAKEV